MRRVLSRLLEGLASATRRSAVTLRRVSTVLRERIPAPEQSGSPAAQGDAETPHRSGGAPRLEGAAEGPPDAVAPADLISRRRFAKAGAGWRDLVAHLRRIREPVRDHEDAILAAALLVGILIMVIHWVR